jgi:hypothetical protein
MGKLNLNSTSDGPLHQIFVASSGTASCTSAAKEFEQLIDILGRSQMKSNVECVFARGL